MASAALQTIVEMLRSSPLAASPSVAEQRQAMEAMTRMFPVAADVRCERVDASGVPAEWISAPGAAADRAILYLHGGGYVLGSIDTHRDLVSRISRASGARGLAIDYRLAPENPHPAAVEDATTAYRWLLDQDLDPASVVVAGDSAGGGLTVATLVALRDAGDPLPAAGVCLSPWVDLEAVGESMTTRADEDPMVQREALIETAKHYLGGADARTPLAAPLYADLAGLPPLLIQVGTAETLLDDSTRLSERAKAAGVYVELERWEDMIHVFQAFGEMLPEAQQAIGRIGEFIRKRLD
jgi:monoterpene epsilon-lactone hydrolase